jgi:glycosyltransferase involved in cell wall biosynthesis
MKKIIIVTSIDKLAEKMIWFIEHSEHIEPMGIASRRMVEKKFDVRKVNAKMLDIIVL